MSSSIQAVIADEQYWEKLHKVLEVPRWGLYSPEYYHCKELHEKWGLKGRRLRLAVQHAIEREDLEKKHALNWMELDKLEELEKKYE